jgi:alpha-ribazole phosphatase
MEVYLIRHTKPKIDAGVCYGQSDISCVDSFMEEADLMIKNIPEKFEAVYSSPLIRCRCLAEKLAPPDSIHFDQRLMEVNFGLWEMKNWDDIDNSSLEIWMKDFVNEKPELGESLIELNQRVDEFISELEKLAYEKVAIITHAGVIRCIVARFLEIPLQNIFKIQVDYGSVTKIRLGNGNPRIEFVNMG